MNREKYLQYINEKLSVLTYQIENYNSVNISSLNIHSEYFFCELFNLIFKLKLNNTNFECSNYVAIDLADEVNKVAIQVTSNNAKKKLVETVNKFTGNNFSSKFDKLFIYNLTQKTSHKSEIIALGNNVFFDTKKNILDKSDIIKKISGLNSNELKGVFDLFHLNFDNNIKNEKSSINENSECKEVNTFINIIEILSDEENFKSTLNYIENPDPDFKINKRFKDHSDFLINTFVELHGVYDGTYSTIHDNFQVSTLKHKKMELYLRTFSDYILTNCKNNPQDAFNQLTDFFSKKLSEKNIEYDDGAVRYTLIKHLIACNVFPQKVSMQQDLL